jgi:thiamine biosynthesis protein ThiS
MKGKVFVTSFVFNGEPYKLQSYKLFTLKEILTFFDYKENLVVLEYNGKISTPKNWSRIPLKNQDRLEILTIVGGG